MLKGDEYCKIHRLLSRVTPVFVWEDMRDMYTVNNVNLLPEEFQLDYITIKRLLSDKFDCYLGQLEILYEDTKHLTDKELGLVMKDIESPVKNFLFTYRRNPNILFTPNLIRNSFFNIFKPKSNILDGYIPSSAMNHFSNDK
jgi:RNA ligase